MLNVMNVPTILHVDDDENDRLLLSLAQRSARICANLMAVEDGEQAIAYLQGNNTDSQARSAPLPDLVLLDLKLPLKSGLEVLEWIRAQDKLQHLPVIILSSSEQEADQQRAFANGANYYFVKPVSLEGMVEMIKHIHADWLSSTPLAASV
jgi:CheY-like chemotaxis protein